MNCQLFGENLAHTVLIIEDDHDTRVMLRRALEAEGYFVFSATNGVDGFAAISRIRPPSVILLGQRMPFMNGDEFLQRQARITEFADIPVITLSVCDTQNTGSLLDVIEKSIDLESLLGIVQRYCSESYIVMNGFRRDCSGLEIKIFQSENQQPI